MSDLKIEAFSRLCKFVYLLIFLPLKSGYIRCSSTNRRSTVGHTKVVPRILTNFAELEQKLMRDLKWQVTTFRAIWFPARRDHNSLPDVSPRTLQSHYRPPVTSSSPMHRSGQDTKQPAAGNMSGCGQRTLERPSLEGDQSVTIL